MSDVDVERLRSIKSFPSLVKYLRDELEWPIDSDDFDELTFDYEPEELGLDAKTAVKIKEIKQLRPLASNQPWGIFFVNFEPKRLPVVVLRRILRSLVLKKRQSANKPQQAAWQLHDLLFISAYGESEHRDITLANFSDDSKVGDLPTLKVLGWDDEDTVLHLAHAHDVLKEKLHWPENPADLDNWRRTWSQAFTLKHREVIGTSKEMAERMAELATAIRKRVNKVLAVESDKGPLRKLMTAFREALIHDLSEDDFADMYAQTITYGLLSARVSRPAGLVAENVADMVPITNPFLRDLLSTFLTVGGRKGNIDFDELGINDVVQALRDADMQAVLRDFGDKNRQEDPVIHFYELFLKEYDPEKRMKRGVFYTPRPVVSFIVRSVDEILRKEFGLADGLADTTTWGEMAKRHPELTIPNGAKLEDPFVQILDPACGTGTFLVEVIDVIHQTMKAKWRKQGHMALEFQNLWNEYVSDHLLPRLYGFELMMAPYAIAHMKIGLKLEGTGYRFGSHERARIYLTNSLEPPQDFSDRFEFDAPALAHEAQAVNAVKRHKRFTAVVGNPPYSNFGQLNRIPFILELLDDYKRDLEEKKLNLDDDFIKFVRLGQWFIDRAGLGILGLITNNTYIDGITHRRMRESLLKAFNKSIIVDLHGSSIKEERSPDGSKDENVFDIQQGVAISIFANVSSRSRRRVFHGELWGSRETKYVRLINGIAPLKEIVSDAPYFFLVLKDFSGRKEFEEFISLKVAMPTGTSAVQTKRDALFVDFDKAKLAQRMKEVIRMGPKPAMLKLYPLAPSAGWSPDCLEGVEYSEKKIRQYLYRPFDLRFIYYDDDLLGRSRIAVFHHLLKPNLALATLRQTVDDGFRHVFLSHCLCDINLTIGHHVSDQVFPLYLYPSEGSFSGERQPNFSINFVQRLSSLLGLKWIRDGRGDLKQNLGPGMHWHTRMRCFIVLNTGAATRNF